MDSKTLDLLNLDDLIQSSHCPICSSSNKLKIKDHLPTNNRYFQSILDHLDISFDELVNKFELVECVDCKIIYYENYLTPDLSNKLYNNLSPVHNLGWYIFNKLISGEDIKNEKTVIQCENVYHYLKKNNIKYNNYAELNCPFMGLIPLFMHTDDMKKIRRRYNRIISKNSHKSFSNQFNENLSKLRSDIKNAIKPQKKMMQNFNNPDSITLFKDSTSNGWDYGCTSGGINCKHLVSNIFDVKLSSFDNDLTDKEEDQFDLIFLSHTLDHCSSPLKILQRSMELSQNIIIITHDINGGPQHKLFITFNFLKWVCEQNSDFKVYDITKSIITSQSDITFDSAYHIKKLLH